MAQLDGIITDLNAAISTALDKKNLGKAQLLGLTELIEDSSGLTTPAEHDLSGDAIYAGYDDVHSIRIYSRLIASNYTYLTEGYGSNRLTNQVSSLIMMVAFKIKTIRAFADNLEAVIVSAFPSGITQQRKIDLGLKSCGFTVTGSTHDTRALFAREFKGHHYTPDTNMKMFEIRYQVECSWGQNCINTICCS